MGVNFIKFAVFVKNACVNNLSFSLECHSWTSDGDIQDTHA